MIEFVKVFNEMDWTNKNAAEDFIKQLEKMGYVLDEETTQALQDFNNSLVDTVIGFSDNVLEVEKVLKNPPPGCSLCG
jgi:hypothetical protein